VLTAGLGLAPALRAHGGMYLGPGATGASSAPPPMREGPATTAPLLPGPGTGGDLGPDLTGWDVWWRINRWRFLEIKRHVFATGPVTGSEGWFLGGPERARSRSLRPSDEVIAGRIVPALLEILDSARDNDLQTGALIALGKIGDLGDPDLADRQLSALTSFLDDSSQEVRESAALALGILASPRVVPTLAHLMWDTAAGRKLVGAREVDPRTRAFAAYGLGLTGARAGSEGERALLVAMLRRALEGDDTRTRDLSVACVIGLSLVPLETILSPINGVGNGGGNGGDEGDGGPPEVSRAAQIASLLARLDDEREEDLVRAHCPLALARLLTGLEEPHRSILRTRVARDLIERLERDKDDDEILRGCVVALGAIGTNDDGDLDARIRRTLIGLPRASNDTQVRAFALIAMAEIGARFGPGVPVGIADARAFLVQQLLNGKNVLEPWAALACGILARGLDGVAGTANEIGGLQRILRRQLEDEGSADRLGAYALATGLSRDLASADVLLQRVRRSWPDETRGRVALGLGLLGAREAIEPLGAIVADARYHPELLAEASIALGLLGDKDIGVQLVAMLRSARSLAAQSAIASALGVVGDARAVDPLLELLGDRLATDKARAFAAVALGNVADKELLPWNAKIGADLNYRAAPATLFDPGTGNGILDIW
jgi:HEAT repeat protein